MARGDAQSFRHLRVNDFGIAQRFRPRPRPFERHVSPQERRQHAADLRDEVETLAQEYVAMAAEWAPWDHIREKGLVVEIESAPGLSIDVGALDRQKYGFQLLNIRRFARDDGVAIEFSTWFVPDGRLDAFEQMLRRYERETGDRGHRFVVDTIASLRRAAVQQFWTEREPWPEEGTPLWFECWLRAPNDATRARVIEQFVSEAQRVGIRVGAARLKLREHTVIMAFAQPEQFTQSSALLSCIAELRRGRDIAAFIDGLSVPDQAGWAADLAARISLPPDNISICLLDTGVNRGHPILSAMLAAGDNHSIKPADWGAGDDYPGHGHGTPMAGLCLFGDIESHLAGTGPISPPAILEAVKIVPPVALINADEKAAAAYTAQGVATAEQNRPDRRRIWCIATSMPGVNAGVPSSWSAEIDQLTAGTDRDDHATRLIVLAAGNVPQDLWRDYPNSNFTCAPQNPAQAWNALVVGAFTEMTGDPLNPAPRPPFVEPGSLAPCAPTSLPWLDTLWPYRPDVVFEGGNAEEPLAGSDPLVRPDLQPLSISADFGNGAFCSFGATSAAAASAANFAATIVRQYSDYRPETVRALICHSAEWTERMNALFGAGMSEKVRHQHLLRTVGYGVPSMRRAVETLRSRVTMIAERSLRPYQWHKSRASMKNMDIYSLPWADSSLTAHPDEIVRIKVTLSYFVEPNPGNRGYTSIYRYAGCQLRFRVSDPGQGRAELVAAISAADNDGDTERRDEAEAPNFPRDDRWMIGPRNATRGSLHSDYWEGPAALAADMKHIAIYPVTGWWKTRVAQGRIDADQPYSLIVTLESVSGQLDLYTEIATTVATRVTV